MANFETYAGNMKKNQVQMDKDLYFGQINTFYLCFL